MTIGVESTIWEMLHFKLVAAISPFGGTKVCSETGDTSCGWMGCPPETGWDNGTHFCPPFHGGMISAGTKHIHILSHRDSPKQPSFQNQTKSLRFFGGRGLPDFTRNFRGSDAAKSTSKSHRARAQQTTATRQQRIFLGRIRRTYDEKRLMTIGVESTMWEMLHFKLLAAISPFGGTKVSSETGDTSCGWMGRPLRQDGIMALISLRF